MPSSLVIIVANSMPDTHNWVESDVITPATCSAVGTKTFVCSHNSEHTRTEDVAIASDAHSFGAWKNDVATATVVAGSGGFAIFRFAIRKKKWSDLVRVFKKK